MSAVEILDWGAPDRPAADPVRTALARHPVYRVLPPAAQETVASHGRQVTVEQGETVDLAGRLRFITCGAVGFFPSRGRTCVDLLGPGSVHGWELAFSRGADEVARAILRSEWIETPADVLAETTGLEWMEHVYARHAVARTRRLEAEADCNATHHIPQRVAKWILRLQACACQGHEPLKITQAMLAGLMGVRRTSVNAASRALQTEGILRFTRGRLIISCPARLDQAACDCDRVGP